MKDQEELEMNIIKKYGGTDIEPYCLVNNTGYTFILNGIKLDARHWRNVYGAECNFFDIHGTVSILDDETRKLAEQIKEELNKNIGY